MFRWASKSIVIDVLDQVQGRRAWPASGESKDHVEYLDGADQRQVLALALSALGRVVAEKPLGGLVALFHDLGCALAHQVGLQRIAQGAGITGDRLARRAAEQALEDVLDSQVLGLLSAAESEMSRRIGS
mgnify:CR=1 FL=1